MGLLRVLTLVRLVGVVLVVAAIVAQAKVGIDAGAFEPTRFFAYFTIQSNLIGMVALLLVLAARGGERSRGLELLHGAAAVYLRVTFVVVMVLLSHVDVGLQLPWVDRGGAQALPGYAWQIGLSTRRTSASTSATSLYWFMYPAIWVAATLVRGASHGWYPYPFLGSCERRLRSVWSPSSACSSASCVLSCPVRRARGCRSRPPSALPARLTGRLDRLGAWRSWVAHLNGVQEVERSGAPPRPLSHA